jgi:hypothetical protein
MRVELAAANAMTEFAGWSEHLEPKQNPSIANRGSFPC